MAFYISKTNTAATDPCRTNTSDTFVTKGYDTENEAFAVLSKVAREAYGDYRIVEYTHINNELTISTCRQPF